MFVCVCSPVVAFFSFCCCWLCVVGLVDDGSAYFLVVLDAVWGMVALTDCKYLCGEKCQFGVLVCVCACACLKECGVCRRCCGWQQTQKINGCFMFQRCFLHYMLLLRVGCKDSGLIYSCSFVSKERESVCVYLFVFL